jgi:hypothetical protein
MQRDQAVQYLRAECVFDDPLTEIEAEQIWRRYSEAVQGLGTRNVTCPPIQTMDTSERRIADAFMEAFRVRLGVQSIQDVIKIDPGLLVARQFYVIIDQSKGYAEEVCTAAGWAKHCLPAIPPQPKQIRIFTGVNAANVELPHAEFFFTHDAQRGQFTIQEYLRHVSVSRFAAHDRMLLWAGYHRSYARMASAVPDAMVRSALMVLTTDGTFDTSPGAPDQGLRAIICGDAPPLFADFLDDRLVMKVKLRKKRFELQIRANLVALDA